MNKHSARTLAAQKGISVKILGSIPRFVFNDGTSGLIDSAATLERVYALPDIETKVPKEATDLQGLTREEREAKALELISQCEEEKPPSSGLCPKCLTDYADEQGVCHTCQMKTNDGI